MHCLTLLENYPPVITGGDRFRVTIGQESTYNFKVKDEGDKFTVTVLGELGTSRVSLTNDSNGNYSFKLTLNEPKSLILSFVAEDSKGAAASLNPIVEVCGCTNGGNCTLQGLLQIELTSVIMNCECPEGIIQTC